MVETKMFHILVTITRKVHGRHLKDFNPFKVLLYFIIIIQQIGILWIKIKLNDIGHRLSPNSSPQSVIIKDVSLSERSIKLEADSEERELKQAAMEASNTLHGTYKLNKWKKPSGWWIKYNNISNCFWLFFHRKIVVTYFS